MYLLRYTKGSVKNNILRYLRVSTVSIASLLILPIMASIYLVIKAHTANLSEGNVTTLYLDLQSSWFGRFLTQGWVDFFSWARTMVFWLLALLAVFFVVWLLSLVMISIDNHYKQQGLANFQVPAGSWHSNFIAVFLVKAGLVLTMLASFVVLVTGILPAYDNAVTTAIQNFGWGSLAAALMAGIAILIAQYVIIVLVKLMRSIRLN